jgi:TDG/mug DNA glycosylase family protein
MILPDVLNRGLKVVFCGMAAGNKSAARSQYYAGRGNKFYQVLHQIKLTPTQLNPSEFLELPKYNVGLTDLAKKAYGNDDLLNKNDFDVNGFKLKIQEFEPQIVCFNGKAAASIFVYGTKSKTGKIDYGFLPLSIGETKLYVAPSTSGSANSSWDIKKWQDLLKYI